MNWRKISEIREQELRSLYGISLLIYYNGGWAKGYYESMRNIWINRSSGRIIGNPTHYMLIELPE